MGYDKGSPAYLVYFPESGEVRRVRCVKFSDTFSDVHELEFEEKPLSPAPRTADATTDVVTREEQPVNERPDETDETLTQPTETSGRRYPSRQCNKPKWLAQDYVLDEENDEVEEVKIRERAENDIFKHK